jgi:hypothetical protein
MSFGAFRDGQLVSVVHHDEKHPDVAIWRAKVERSHAGADGHSGTYDVFLLEITKHVAGVDPDTIFRPSQNLPAV